MSRQGQKGSERTMNDQDKTRETGQSIILVAVAFLALILFAAIAVDISRAYFDRRSAQNAADAAAWAGGQELGIQRNTKNFPNSSEPADIRKAMNDFAQRNGVADSNDDPDDEWNDNVEGYYLVPASVEDSEPDLPGLAILQEPTLNPPFTVHNRRVPDNAVGVLALTHVEAPTFFGGVFGLNDLPISAEAAVSVNIPPCGVTCVVPVATYWYTDEREFLPSTEPEPWVEWGDELPLPSGFNCYNIWNGQGPGNFGWLNWSNQGHTWHENDCDTRALEYNLTPNRCIGYVAIGMWVAGTTGRQNASLIQDELDYWAGTYTRDPQPFIVPLYFYSRGTGCGPNGGAEYKVVGFAKMQLIGYKLPQGDSVDPWVSPERCTTTPGEIPGEDPNEGTRLTAIFYDFVKPDSLAGYCDSYGTITMQRFIR
jgi:hypothetical protein